LHLPGVEIEPADRAGHDLAWQQAHCELMALAQALGQRDPQIAARQSHFVG
jgi:hypothetical protein